MQHKKPQGKPTLTPRKKSELRTPISITIEPEVLAWEEHQVAEARWLIAQALTQLQEPEHAKKTTETAHKKSERPPE